ASRASRVTGRLAVGTPTGRLLRCAGRVVRRPSAATVESYGRSSKSLYIAECCCGKDKRCACWSPRKSHVVKGKKAKDGDAGGSGGADDGNSNRRPSPGASRHPAPPHGPSSSSAADSETPARGSQPPGTALTRSHEHGYSPYNQAYERTRAAVPSVPDPLPTFEPYISANLPETTAVASSAADDIFADLLAPASSRDATLVSVSSAATYPSADSQLPVPDSLDQPQVKIECDEGGCGDLCSCPHEPTITEPFPTCKKPAACTTACLSCFIMTVPPDDCLATGNLLSDTSNLVNNTGAGSSASWEASAFWSAPDEARRDAAMMEARMQNLFKDVTAVGGLDNAGGDPYGFDVVGGAGELSSDFLQSASRQWN
ncbi:hypothetical protein EV715DRAFT_206172, partial [Schizophyllum commune]